MIPLNGEQLKSLPVGRLEHVRELVAFDGPLLTQLRHPSGEQYLQYWCDCDESVERWMILRISEANILRLMNGFIPLDMIIPNECRDDFVYFVDSPKASGPDKVFLVPKEGVPFDYRPATGAFLEEIYSPLTQDSYSFVVEGGWSVKALGDFPHVFSKAYSLLYGFTFLHWNNIVSFPWRGGFSAMHFFNWASQQVAGEHRPNVSAMQYASPGFMRFSLHRPTAQEVINCIVAYKTSNVDIAAAYSKLASRIRDHNLNDVHSPDDPVWIDHDAFLQSEAVKLMNGFGVIDGVAFATICGRPFEAAKIAMAFYRQVRDLVEFEKDGLVRYPRSDRARAVGVAK
jgi:hypothetical protein